MVMRKIVSCPSYKQCTKESYDKGYEEGYEYCESIYVRKTDHLMKTLELYKLTIAQHRDNYTSGQLSVYDRAIRAVKEIMK